ncbi:MAG: hypothetical protein ACRC1K_00515, partial [Planctomycetia bacterium]
MTSTLLLRFAERYEREGNDVIGKELQEMHRQTVKEVLRKSSIADRLEGVPIEQRLEGVPIEQRLEGVPV